MYGRDMGIGFEISIWKSKRKERVFLDICQSGKTCREWISKQALELMEKFEIHNSVSVEYNPFVQTPMVYGIRNPKFYFRQKNIPQTS